MFHQEHNNRKQHLQMGIFDNYTRYDVNPVAVTVLPLINSSENACLMTQHVSAQELMTSF